MTLKKCTKKRTYDDTMRKAEETIRKWLETVVDNVSQWLIGLMIHSIINS